MLGPSRSRRRWWGALGAGVVALAAGIALLASARELPPAFSVAASGPAASSTAPTSAGRTAPPMSDAPAPRAPFRPSTLTMTAFGVVAPVDLALSGDGVLSPPDDPARVGWWAASALSGSSSGSTVLVGHVDGPHGPGALYRLIHTRPGDHIIVADSNGRRVTYAVTSLQYHGKGQRLPASLFASAGPPRLVVISCGGPFDRSTDQYEDNVVVEATPI